VFAWPVRSFSDLLSWARAPGTAWRLAEESTELWGAAAWGTGG